MGPSGAEGPILVVAHLFKIFIVLEARVEARVYLSGQLYPCCWLDDKQVNDPEYAVLQTEETNIKYNTVDKIMNSDILKTFYDNLSTNSCPKYCKKKCTTNLKNPSRIIA